jgi:hypothetical protein
VPQCLRRPTQFVVALVNAITDRQTAD